LSIVGLTTTEIFVHNGYRNHTFPIKVNNKEYQISPKSVIRITTSRFFNNVEFNTAYQKIDKKIKKGYYVISSGVDYQLRIEEKKYRSIKSGERSSEYQQFLM